MKSLAVVVLLALCTACGTSSATPPAPPAPTTTSTTKPLQIRANKTAYELPSPVSRPAVATRGATVLLLGGLTTGDVSTDAVTQIDTDSSTVTKQSPLAAKVHDAAATSFSTGALVFAGGSSSITNTVQQWNAGKSSTVGHLPEVRADLVATKVGDRSIVIGGTNGKTLDSDVYATTDGSAFTKVGALAQGVRYPAITTVGNTVWLFGGETQPQEGGLVSRSDIIQTFDVNTGEAKIIGHLPQALSHAMAFTLDGRTYVAGGRTNASAIDTIASVNSSATVVTVGALPQSISDCGIAVVNNTAYLFGGEIKGPADPQKSVLTVSLG
jgi:N-acetylneuraminic acid mutarotase